VVALGRDPPSQPGAPGLSEVIGSLKRFLPAICWIDALDVRDNWRRLPPCRIDSLHALRLGCICLPVLAGRTFLPRCNCPLVGRGFGDLPDSNFPGCPIHESLFLALTMAGFIAAYKGRWLVARLLGCLASLARGQGIFTSAALAWIAWDQWRGMQCKRRVEIALMLAGLALPVIGGLTFLHSATGWDFFP